MFEVTDILSWLLEKEIHVHVANQVHFFFMSHFTLWSTAVNQVEYINNSCIDDIILLNKTCRMMLIWYTWICSKCTRDYFHTCFSWYFPINFMDGLHADIPKVISTCPRQSEEDFVKFNKRLECYAKKVSKIWEKALFFCEQTITIMMIFTTLKCFSLCKKKKRQWSFIIYIFVNILLFKKNKSHL